MKLAKNKDSKSGNRRPVEKRPRIDFDLRQLEVFSKVVELGSISAAADAVNLTQSSVSERMSNLEMSIGANLFDRVGRRIEPTALGNVLYKQALKHLALKEDTRQVIEGQMGISTGEVVMGGSTIPGEYLLPQAIKQFRDAHEGIVVRLKIMDSAQVADEVAEGVFALGVIGARCKYKQLKHEALWQDELVLAVPAKHPWAKQSAISVTDLLDEPFVLREAGSGTRQVMEYYLNQALGNRQVELNIAAELGSSTAVKSAVIAGMGVTVISSRAVEEEVKAGRLAVVQIGQLAPPRSFYLIHDSRRNLAPVCRALRDFLLTAAHASRAGA